MLQHCAFELSSSYEVQHSPLWFCCAVWNDNWQFWCHLVKYRWDDVNNVVKNTPRGKQTSSSGAGAQPICVSSAARPLNSMTERNSIHIQSGFYIKFFWFPVWLWHRLPAMFCKAVEKDTVIASLTEDSMHEKASKHPDLSSNICRTYLWVEWCSYD